MQFFPSQDCTELFAVSLTYDGGIDAQNHRIDLYDISTALTGLSRSLIITSSFVLNGKIITRVPDIKNIKITTSVPQEGSISFRAVLYHVGPIILAASMASNDSVIGHLTWSAYDYVINTAIGVHVTPDIPLATAIRSGKVTEQRLRAMAQKLERPVLEMHRPIATGSATKAEIVPLNEFRGTMKFDLQSYDAIRGLKAEEIPIKFKGRVSQYNANTRRGMVFLLEEQRSIGFILDNGFKSETVVFSKSLSCYDESMKKIKSRESGFFNFLAKRVLSKNGLLKSLVITNVFDDTLVVK